MSLVIGSADPLRDRIHRAKETVLIVVAPRQGSSKPICLQFEPASSAAKLLLAPLLLLECKRLYLPKSSAHRCIIR